jgi:hypothetical protein
MADLANLHQQVIGRLIAAELELEAKGYTARESHAATKRAWRWSARITAMLPDEIQSTALPALIEQQLRGSEQWLQGIREARQRGEYRRALARAARDGRWEEGLRKAGVESPRDGLWSDSIESAARGWERGLS